MNQEKIGKYIYELRIKNNLTQKVLADKLSITSQAVSKWENGRGIPDIEQLNNYKVYPESTIKLIKSEKLEHIIEKMEE